MPDVTPSSTPTQSLDPLYSRNPGAVQSTAQTATSSDIGANNTAEKATLGGYQATMGADSADTKSANQLNTITSQNSPLMQRAAAQGMLTAARRGLENSSIAAGAAQGEMVDRAAPLAMQDATTAANRDLTNQAATNRASEFTSQQENVGSLENARAQNELNTTKAQMDTAVSQGNAQLTTNVGLANTEAENKMRADVLDQNAKLNTQFLAGTQAMDLASIQGRYSQLISSNTTAGQLFDSYTTGVASIMANSSLSPERVAQSVQIQQTMLEAGLRMIDNMNALNLDQFTLPGTTTSGGQIVTTPGTGTTATTGTTPGTPAPAPAAIPPRPVPTPGHSRAGDIAAWDKLYGPGGTMTATPTSTNPYPIGSTQYLAWRAAHPQG